MDLLLEAGPSGYLLVLIGVGGLALAGLSFVLVSDERLIRWGVLASTFAVGLSVVTLLLGVWGRTAGVSRALAASLHASAADRATILAAGTAEAGANLTLAVVVGLPLLLAASASLARAFFATRARS